MKELDPLLHSQLRLSIMSLLLSVEEADFVFLRQETHATAGNLSIQLEKLSEAGYILIRKSFIGRKSHTVCSMTPLGREAMVAYMTALKEYFSKL